MVYIGYTYAIFTKCLFCSFAHDFHLLKNEENTPTILNHTKCVFDVTNLRQKKKTKQTQLPGLYNCIYCIKTRRQLA